MKCFTTLLSAIALPLLSAAASHSNMDAGSETKAHCLTQAEACQLTDRFAAVFNKMDSDIGSWKQTAEAILSENYYAVSDSILSLENLTLSDQHVNAGKKHFIEMLEENGAAGFENTNSTLSLVADCNKVVWYFQQRGYGPKHDLHGGRLATHRLKGFYLIFVDVRGLIDHVYVELNSIAAGLDLGTIKYIGNASVAGGP